MSNIHARFVQLIDLCTEDVRRFKDLETISGIPATSWRKAYHGGQRPTVEMLQALGLHWPEHVFWLITGVTDNEFSHTSPTKSSILDSAYESRPAGTDALKLRTRLYQLLSQENEPTTLIDRWENWLTAHQEKFSKKLPWLYSVHPKLAKRKIEKLAASRERENEISVLIQQIDLARKQRISEFLNIYGTQEN